MYQQIHVHWCLSQIWELCIWTFDSADWRHKNAHYLIISLKDPRTSFLAACPG